MYRQEVNRFHLSALLDVCNDVSFIEIFDIISRLKKLPKQEKFCFSSSDHFGKVVSCFASHQCSVSVLGHL